MLKNKKGFTLIELLVVIAIIGILSAVVLASLNSARGKGQDAAIKGELGNIRSQAQIYRDTNNSYYPTFVAEEPIIDSCTNTEGLVSDSYVRGQLAAINLRFNATTTCFIGTSTYAISAILTNGSSWCVDSNGLATSSSAGAEGLCQ